MNLKRNKPLQFTGPSLHMLLWQKMDQVTDKIMRGDKSEKTVGKGIGISQCLAIFTNPYNPDPKAIRADAKKRWSERNAKGSDE